MNKLTQTAKRLDTFFHIMQIVTNVLWIGALACVGILLVGVVFRLDPKTIGTVYGSLELGFVELDIAQAYAPSKSLILAQAGTSLAFGAAFMFVAWHAVKEIRRILVPMIQGEPFQSVVSSGLKKLAILSLFLGIIGNAAILAEQLFTVLILDLPSLLISEKITHLDYNFSFDLTFLLAAAVFLLMSYVFHYGEELQQLSDETL